MESSKLDLPQSGAAEGKSTRSGWQRSRSFFRKQFDGPRVQYRIAPALLVISALIFLLWIPSDSALGVNVGNVVKNGITYCLLGLGASIVISAGQIDLSSIGVATISGVIFAILSSLWAPLGYFMSGLAVCLSAMFGLLSGALVAFAFSRLRVPVLIFTWALGSIYVILAILLAGLFADQSAVPLPWRAPVEFWKVGGLGFWVSIAAIAAATIILAGINLPQRAAALGASETSAIHAGVSRERTWAECFIFNGILASAAGIVHALYMEQASTRDLPGNELIPIAIAVLGGTVLSGGYLAIGSVVAAAFFWSCTKLIGPHLPMLFPSLEVIEAELGPILFYSIFLIISVLFGKWLVPSVPKILARRET